MAEKLRDNLRSLFLEVVARPDQPMSRSEVAARLLRCPECGCDRGSTRERVLVGALNKWAVVLNGPSAGKCATCGGPLPESPEGEARSSPAPRIEVVDLGERARRGER